jgi:hypothetical protein
LSITVTVNGQTGPTIKATTGDTIGVTVSAANSPGATGAQGPAGPANSLSIGTVTSGTAAATITGTAPSQVLNLVLQKGDTGSTGPQGPAGSVNLADETPQPLGTASAGTALTAARADHVHAVGSITFSSLSGIPSTFTPAAHVHAVSDVTGLQTALDSKQPAGTYATLVGGTVPSAQLPSFVDDIVEYANLAAFTEQSTGKIYVARDTGKIYRWSGSAYIEISPSPGSTDSVTEGSVNLYHTTNRAAAAAPVQSVNMKTGAVALTASDVGAAATSHTHSLADLTQSSATTGQVPTWNGTAWAAATPSGGGGGGSANIVEAATAAGFPATGAAQTLYVSTDASRVYRWSGSVYVEIGTAGGTGTDSDLRALFVPAAPTSVTATGGNAQATVSWTAPAALSVLPITDYTIQYSTNSGSTWTTFTRAASAATSATVTGLTNGTAVVFRVSATNGVGTSSYSTASSAVTPAAPSAVPVTYANRYGAAGASHSVTGATTVTAVLNGNSSFANDSARLWLLINVTGTLSYTVTASSQAGGDIGRLHISSASPSSSAAMTAVSSEVSGTQTTSGTASVTAGQHLVLVYTKDSEDSELNDRVTAVLSIS